MLQHKTPIKGEVVEEWVEQYPTPADYQKAMRNEDHNVYRRPFGDDVATSGSWWLGVRLGEKGWKAYENGEVTAFSPYAFSMKRSGTTADLPKVKIIELVPK